MNQREKETRRQNKRLPVTAIDDHKDEKLFVKDLEPLLFSMD